MCDRKLRSSLVSQSQADKLNSWSNWTLLISWMQITRSEDGQKFQQWRKIPYGGSSLLL